MGTRRDRLDTRLADQKAGRLRNSVVKNRERARRRGRMVEFLKSNPTAPFPPHVESWLAGELGKKARQITEDDVKKLTM